MHLVVGGRAVEVATPCTVDEVKAAIGASPSQWVVVNGAVLTTSAVAGLIDGAVVTISGRLEGGVKKRKSHKRARKEESSDEDEESEEESEEEEAPKKKKSKSKKKSPKKKAKKSPKKKVKPLTYAERWEAQLDGRPDLKKGISVADMQNLYYEGELRAYAQKNGLRSTGKKAEIIKIINTYFTSGEKILPLSEHKAAMALAAAERKKKKA